MTDRRVLDAIIKFGDQDAKTIKIASMSSMTEGETPSVFFSNKSKPALAIMLGTLEANFDAEWQTFQVSLWKHLSEDSLNVEWVKTFFYFFFKKEIEPLTSEWSSYGLIISTKKDDKFSVTPWDSIAITETKGAHPGNMQTVAHAAPIQDLGWKLALAFAGINRLIRVANKEYRDMLILSLGLKVALPLFDNQGGTDHVSFAIAATAYGSWAQDAGFCKMVAALDMFYHRFKNGRYALVRWGTIPCRDKDLGAMLALEDLRLQTESSLVSEVLSWIWLESIGREVGALMSTEGDLTEAITPHSYFHYQADMGAVSSSKYASVHNRKLYTLTHMVGTLLNQRRSYNAYLIEPTNVHSIYKNAIFIAYACRVSHNLRPVGAPETKREDFLNAIKPANEEEDDIDDQDEMNPEPKTRNALEWFLYWRGFNYQVTDKLRDWLGQTVDTISEPREGTIGQWIKQNGKVIP
uniref:Nucleoprotein n=53 Tax=Drosophila immigrans sigmavirus TaxID=1002360 RepID=A0A140D8L7_9RHAB|nr:nucleocapsid protein [Drosophila immigrans sigmavirus]